MQPVTDLKNDLRIVSISEESYATDYDGAYVADTAGPARVRSRCRETTCS